MFELNIFIEKSFRKLLLFTIILSTLASCVSKKDILYLQDIEKMATNSDAMFSTPVIQPNDILSINVTAFDMEAAAPFNLIMPARTVQELTNTSTKELQGYLVSIDGTIEFPVLGTLKVAGLSRQELIEKMKEEIRVYIKDPIVNVTISNYKVTVLGEVMRPGIYNIPDERITLLEALGKAGDLTIYGKRTNIILLREQDGVKTHSIIDITKSDFLNSPYYFLKQNDVIYVQPNSAQVNSAAYNRNSSVYISIASVLVSLIVLISR
ncbi:MAG: polysaccharide biosynthesis/export family protein [Flavobacteriaceae bacterium]|nr:polysaccharide biosynthesis/export family protein [Flavobacteriaceae bacterium]